MTPKAAHYGVIYVDPPWSFSTYSAKGKGRSAEAHYDTMSLSDIANLRVVNYAAKDCVLLMWVTDPFLPTALSIINCWGFDYKTVGFYWAKTLQPERELVYDEASAQIKIRWAMGTGYWTRANPEQCLLATRGKPKRLNADVRKLIVSPRREHSRKPDEAYERIERLCAGPYLELFARFPRSGWDSWGTMEGIGERRWKSNTVAIRPVGEWA